MFFRNIFYSLWKIRRYNYNYTSVSILLLTKEIILPFLNLELVMPKYIQIIWRKFSY